MPSIVPPTGPEDAALFILGEAPGKEEAKEGKPFVGPSGRLLWDTILARAGIRPSHARVANVHWKMPYNSKWENIPESELGMFDEQTIDAIISHPRKVIVAVGSHALAFLLEGTAASPVEYPSTRWRGSILTTDRWAAPLQQAAASWPDDPIIIPMIHPSAVLRSSGHSDSDLEGSTNERKAAHYRPLCIHDAKRIKLALDGGLGRPPKRRVHHPLNTSKEELLAILQEVAARTDTPIAFDIETYAHTITCLGVAWSPFESAVISLVQEGICWDPQDIKLLEAMADVLDNAAPKIGQHLDYDVQHLAQLGIPVRNVWLDTAVAHSILHPEMPHDLGTITSLYTLQPYFKDMREDDKETSEIRTDEDYFTYNGLDCCVTWEDGVKLDRELMLSS